MQFTAAMHVRQPPGVGAAVGRRLALVLPLAALLAAGPLAGASGIATATTGPQELVYVASADSGPVRAYAATSAGAVTAIREVDDPDNPSTVWDPWGVAFDPAGDLYVQSFLSDATTFVFAPHAGAGALPIRIFRVNGPDSRSIAVDGQGLEYVTSGESSSVISVAAPGASGQPANLYSVPPVRMFDTDETGFNPWPEILAIGGGNELVAGLARSGGNAIETFAGGAGGSSMPLRVISGPHTGLGSEVANSSHLAVTYSPFTGRIYVAVSSGTSTHISVFARTASGDVSPVRTIQGPATGLAGNVITGIADSQVTGDIYALVKAAQFNGPGRVEVFGRLASGNAAPLRTFTDAGAGFGDAAGIGITTR